MDTVTVETSRCEHREPKPHVINPRCFGADFTAWLRGEGIRVVSDEDAH